MSMSSGSITVSTSTGGEIRVPGLAVDLYDAILTAGANGGSFAHLCGLPPPLATQPNCENPPTWEYRHRIAVLCNALAPAIISFITTNAVVSGASIT